VPAAALLKTAWLGMAHIPNQEETHLMSKKIGWIGLGRMGEAMVTKLLKAGHAVHVWNRTANLKTQ